MPYHDEEDFEFYNALHRLQPSVPPESGLGPRGNALSAVAEDPYVQEPWRGIGRRMEENVPGDVPWSGSVLGRAGSTFGKWASGRLPQAPSEIPSIPSGVFADQVPDFTRKMYPQDDSGQLLLTPGQAQLLTAQNVPGPQGVLNRLSAIAQHFDPSQFGIGGLRGSTGKALSLGKKATQASPGKKFPIAKDVVDGRRVRLEDGVPNMESIPATLNEFEILPGIREVPMSEFQLTGRTFDVQGNNSIRDLQRQIAVNKEITPLIVVVDREGSYILEGATRSDALFNLKAKSLPAKVVIDTSEATGFPQFER